MKQAIVLAVTLALVGCGGEAKKAAQAAADSAAQAKASAPPLLNPRMLNDTAPPVYHARFATSEGEFVVEVHRDWSPRGADRFYNLVKARYYDSVYVHRVLPGLAQFGFYPDPRINNFWLKRYIGDDPVKESNTRGRMTYAHAGKNTRATQIFINKEDNSNLDAQGFAPLGEVVDGGMAVVDKFYGGYGELAPDGNGPSPGQAAFKGNAYLSSDFPKLSLILNVTIDEAPAAPPSSK